MLLKNTKRSSACFLLTLAVAGCLTAAACAPNSASDRQNEGESSSANGESAPWSIESDCRTCHVGEASSSTDSSCLYSHHSSISCQECHTDVDGGLTKGHENYLSGKTATRLKRSTVDQGICSSCHDQQDLVDKTAACQALSDDNGTTVNPHAVPDNDQHDSITCTSCHKVHANSSGVDETSKATCKSCHHENVYECGTCHE